jgi:hypothetical protein
VLAAAAADGAHRGPNITATCYDCGLFSETDVLGTVSFRVAEILRLSQGWREVTCQLASPEGERIVGENGAPTELRLAFLIEKGFLAQV